MGGSHVPDAGRFAISGFNALDLRDHLLSKTSNGAIRHCFMNGRVHPTPFTVPAGQQNTSYRPHGLVNLKQRGDAALRKRVCR